MEVTRSADRTGFAAAARIGLERVRGEIIVLVRDAVQPQLNWLAPLVEALDDPCAGLAASATVGAGPRSPVAAWAVAVRANDLRDVGLTEVPGELVFGALALSLAERGLRAVSVDASTIAAPGTRTGAARRPPGESPELTIVIPTLDAASDRVRACVAAVQATTDVAHEIVIVDNGCPPRGFTDPVNAGIRAARTPYLVVMTMTWSRWPGGGSRFAPQSTPARWWPSQ